MLGDLPIVFDEADRITHPIDWVDFVDFLRRLEHHAEGREGLEACGGLVAEIEPGKLVRSLVGLSASPRSVYRAAARWAVQRAMPGVRTHLEEIEPNRFALRIELAKDQRPCPQLLHLATGAARAIPRLIGLSDAVVSADIDDFVGRYEITVPPSRTVWARARRFLRTLFSSGAVLDVLESQQLELHAKQDELQQTRTALAESERRHRTLTDAAVDVLCEVDEDGHVVYVSASVEDLIGYTPEQVVGSHFSLWIPSAYRDAARNRFRDFASKPNPDPVTHQRVRLHTDARGEITAELSLRTYRTPEGELRMVIIVRDESRRPVSRQQRRPSHSHEQTNPPVAALRHRIESLVASGSSHPVQRSLALLLASLDASMQEDANERALGRFVSATERMTQIVERAIASSRDATTQFRWHETEKWAEQVASEFRSSPANANRPLRIDTKEAPALFWGEDGLLAAAIGSLLEWTSDQTEPGTEVLVQMAANGGERDAGQGETAEATAEASTEITLSVGPATNPNPTAFIDDADQRAQLRSNLALATAKDAVTALGGDLSVERMSEGHRISRLRVPQPRARHASTMPADPSA